MGGNGVRERGRALCVVYVYMQMSTHGRPDKGTLSAVLESEALLCLCVSLEQTSVT